ncbi:MAG: hypothetical protein ACETVP_06175 [Candidatus Bathyarchaeia archaeon]
MVELYAGEFDGLIDGTREFTDLVRKVKHIDGILTFIACGADKTSSKAIAKLQRQRTSAITKMESILQKI